MDTLGWGLLMMGALSALCVAIIIVACFHAVWLVRVADSLLNHKAIPHRPFSKRKRNG